MIIALMRHRGVSPARPLSRRTLWSLAFLALACLAVVIYKVQAFQALPPGLETMALPPCDPARAAQCESPLPHGGRVVFSIRPQPVRPLEKLQLSVQLIGFPARRVEVGLEGVDMSMGEYRTELAHSAGAFTGQTILPICVSGTMTWQAMVIVHGEAKAVAVPFRFTVPARSGG